MKLLLDNSPISEDPDCTDGKTQKTDATEWKFGRIWRIVRPTKKNLIFAFKSSLSLGLAVFFGLTYNKEKGYWSGLTIAISFVTGRRTTFTLANARAQGTALGSVYGVMTLSIFGLWVIGPAQFTNCLAAWAVAMSAFVVALPESSNLMCKRIAFGNLVIVYVGTIIHGAETGVVMHPIHVTSSTALGALASVLAMLFPYPRLAYYEVWKARQSYIERLKHFRDAICAPDNITACNFISEAKSLSGAAAKLLQSIKSNQEGMLGESPPVRFFEPHCVNQMKKLQDMEISIRGMDIALTYFLSFPVDEEFKRVLLDLRQQIIQEPEHADSSAPFNANTAPGTLRNENLPTFSASLKVLSASFLQYCMKPLLDNSLISEDPDCTEWRFGRIWRVVRSTKKNLVFAFKCSLSLGLAVFFGLTYTKENGYWAGLTIAISFETGRHATFTSANARAQGTALGSVYGVLCSFIFQRFAYLEFLPLLPWIVFSCFLMHSRMYGKAGGISAVIGALLILGRDHYGPPSQFAIARITEATIGLICFITVEILFNPSRAATLAKSQLPQSLRALRYCIDCTFISPGQGQVAVPNTPALRENQKQLKSCLSELKKFIVEAESEPNFCFLPFYGAYRKILESLLKMEALLLIVAQTTKSLSQILESSQVTFVEENMNKDIEDFRTKVSSTLNSLEKELIKKYFPRDIELGRNPNADVLSGNEEVDSITRSFLQHSGLLADSIATDRCNCLAFCMSSLMKEAIRIENEVKELVKWENPS
ncbi:p-hydroxybenzoic acid efflux pump subunit aaeB [Quillaja saponaria]|uniref:p-hydroxybenzoic acid efflux pump subunit aaeB n=1 Tax=Quillaja saponaria TaxID=32244 RepID=A0AAD7Q903_QUISA|nr:p-hydroxybenzoic acid efflux pump subunit aaeB [Quillaja saponaria]KAJ7977111.1 p-hydroxybenzoic acid efflux pump subunit aaeB [Quillaja saponaria]